MRVIPDQTILSFRCRRCRTALEHSGLCAACYNGVLDDTRKIAEQEYRRNASAKKTRENPLVRFSRRPLLLALSYFSTFALATALAGLLFPAQPIAAHLARGLMWSSGLLSVLFLFAVWGELLIDQFAISMMAIVINIVGIAVHMPICAVGTPILVMVYREHTLRAYVIHIGFGVLFFIGLLLLRGAL